MRSWTLSLSVLIFRLCLGSCAGISLSAPDVRGLLMEFYTATGGPRWTDNTGWSSSTDYCNGSWYGVQCEDGQISQIDVRSNALSGSLPASWSSLTQMVILDASKNALSGSLPASWSSLTKMERFYASSNSLSGSLPASWSSLTQMERFYASSNSLSGSLPASWSSLTQMFIFYAYYNSLSGSLPASWSSLTQMGRCHVDRNALSGSLPASWSSLTQMKRFWVFINSLSGSLPASWSSHTQMQRFQVYSNFLSGSLPASWSSLTQMVYFYGGQNSLSGSLPASWSSLTQMEKIDGEWNSLSGSLPASWSSLTKMDRFQVHSNSLSGSLPASWSSLTQLEIFTAHSNHLSGSLPASWSSLTQMERLQAASNSLSGSLPVNWSSLTQLLQFEAFSTSLSGSIPANWSSLKLLWSLLLRSNSLSGTLSSSFANMSTLRYIDLGSNKLSGSFSTAFGAHSQIFFLAIDGNVGLDWDISVFDMCPNITYLLMQHCSIRGTLPSSLSKATQLDTLLLENNLLSGTVPSDFLQRRTLTLEENHRISGTLPKLGGMVRNLLMNGMRLSGTIPKISEAKESCPTCPKTYLPCAMDGFFCVTSPNYPANYGISQSCTIEINAFGTLTASNFSTEKGYDKMSVAGADYSGTVGPVGVPVQAGTTVSWETDRNKNEAGWRLCWSSNSSEPTVLPKSLEVLSLARNYIIGTTDDLEQELALQTLLVSANFLTCQAAVLDNVTNLGQGIFEEPSSGTLKKAGKVLQGVTQSNPFESTPLITLPNIVLVFAGNPLLSKKAAILPPTTGGQLEKEDEIESGRPSLFRGHSNFILLACLVLGLVLFFGVTIAVSVRGVSSIVEFARSGMRTGPESVHANHFLARSFGSLLALAPIGLFCLVVNVVWSKAECIDFIIKSTVAAVDSDSTWQWIWVLLNCCASASVTLMLVRLQHYGANPKGDFNQPQWAAFVCSSDGVASKHAIDVWRVKMEALTPQLSATRSLIFWLLHLPLVCIAMAPSFGYVLALNVPAGSSWYMSILGNSLVVTIFKMLISEFCFPHISRRLARMKFGVGNSAVISSYQLAVRVHRMESNSLLLFGIGTILVAPMIAVFLLDDSCLRYYLSFVDDLRQVMDRWFIGEQGFGAYRPHFCSRTLVFEFTWVWLQMVTIRAFMTPALELVHSWESIRALAASFTACATQLSRKIMCKSKTQCEDLEVDSFKEASCDAELRKVSLVETYIILLVLIAFGPLCPMLFLMAPIFVWTNLCAISWIRSQAKPQSYVQFLVDKVVVQHPTRLFSLFAVLTQWVVASSVFIDLQFFIGPIILYVVFWVVHLAVVSSYYLLHDQSIAFAKPVYRAQTHDAHKLSDSPVVDLSSTADGQMQEKPPTSRTQDVIDNRTVPSKARHRSTHRSKPPRTPKDLETISIEMNPAAFPRRAQQSGHTGNTIDSRLRHGAAEGFHGEADLEDVSVTQTTTRARNADYFESMNNNCKKSQRYKQRFKTLRSHKDSVVQDHKETRISARQLAKDAKKIKHERHALQREQALERDHLHRVPKGELEESTNNDPIIVFI